jgi:predicted GTPase
VKAWRFWSLVTLILLPWVVLAALGGWMLWKSGLLFWTWWVLPVCWGLAYLLTNRWERSPNRLALDGKHPLHWTPRDEEASHLVEAHHRLMTDLSAEQLTDPRFYLDSAMQLSIKIAQHYEPRAADPIASLTLPEILAAAHLAVEDLEDWVRETVPASHLLTVRQWRQLAKAPGWITTTQNIIWAVSTVINPLNAIRYLVSKYTVDPLTKHIQSNLLAAFYSAFVRQVGYYLIEMNSGRLRGGSERYREFAAELRRDGIPTGSPTESGDVSEVTIAITGQVKAGKSSVINALLKDRQASTDVLPATRGVTRYRWQLPDGSTVVGLLDTPGYADADVTAQQLEELFQAFQQADVVLLIMSATSPSRDPDLKFLDAMSAKFAKEPRLRPPPVVGALTHIDGLSPLMEWSPPYDWQHPVRPKEHSIHDAVAYNFGLFNQRLPVIVPVCSDSELVQPYGIEEWLIPAVCGVLDEGRARALVRGLNSQADREHIRELLSQFRNVGRALLKTFVESQNAK